MKFKGNSGEYFEILDKIEVNVNKPHSDRKGELYLIWFESTNNRLEIDSKNYSFKTNEIVFLTEFHKVKVKSAGKVKFLRFNRSFYCIIDHDSEVGCKGILFFGSTQTPVITLDSQHLEILQTVWNMLVIEMRYKDKLQFEMLQMMLKRILILCTRIYKEQHSIIPEDDEQLNILKDFNFLVEKNFRSLHSVSEYAQLLNKSPKTISNIFRKISAKTPLQIIQERLMIEAKRLLIYSNQSVKEIAYELGFKDVQSFSRFFKIREGKPPSRFRLNK